MLGVRGMVSVTLFLIIKSVVLHRFHKGMLASRARKGINEGRP